MLQVRLLGEVGAERDGEQVTLPPLAGRLLRRVPASMLGSFD